jgi:hypothetical protein
MTTDTQTDQQTLTINGKEHPVTSLPQDVQNLLSIYAKWENELKASKVEVFKLEAAIKGLSIEIETRMQQIDSTPEVPQD